MMDASVPENTGPHRSEQSLEGVTTPGDIAILASIAKARRQKVNEYIANYYNISIETAERMIKKARNAGMVIPY